MDRVGKLCPSARCESGNRLLGIQTEGGGLARFLPPPVIDDTFVAAAQETGAPERRFRFAGTCAESACHQWQSGGCSIARMASARSGDDAATSLPPCHIRSACRWFGQEGRAACLACAFVVTDPGGHGTPH